LVDAVDFALGVGVGIVDGLLVAGPLDGGDAGVAFVDANISETASQLTTY
jgi:hypothetical protein